MTPGESVIGSDCVHRGTVVILISSCNRSRRSGFLEVGENDGEQTYKTPAFMVLQRHRLNQNDSNKCRLATG